MPLVELNLNPNRRQLRTFGVIGLVVFGALAAWAWHSGRLMGFQLGSAQSTAVYALGGLAGLCGLFSAAFPEGNKPLFIFLSVVTMPIGFVVSHVVLLAMFFAVITPIGLVMRLAGRDPLARSVDRAQSSYWGRRAPQPPVDRYFRQF